jgi:c-di-GMP-binding flagellar brake protein YcgR
MPMSDRRQTEDRRTAERATARERRGRNRRAFPRWPAEFEVRYKHKSQVYNGVPIDIGENGLSMEVDQPPPLGQEIDLEYRLLDSGDQFVHVKVMVKHIEDNRCGVEFLNLRRADRLKIVDYVYKGRSA